MSRPERPGDAGFEVTRTLPESEPGAPRPARAPLADVVEQGAYLVAGEIGRGGLGQVLEAWDTRLDRRVALKRLHCGGREVEARFAREARLTARLQHPGVVPVYEAGQWPNGEPYYAMQFISGRSLRELLDERHSLDERLALLPSVISVAETMAYAHSMGILHRDLKPSNVLVGAFGETIVIDWGLAKSLAPDDAAPADGDGGDAGGGEAARGGDALATGRGDGHRSKEPPEALTRAGMILGTPAYMPPEQACGQQVDLRADVYALGAILYHVLAGAPPHLPAASGQGPAATQQSPPPPIAEREPGAPPDLVAIVEKAMARAVEDRYPSAAQMAEDLRRFQTGQLVRAHHYSWATLVQRWIRRNLLVVAVSGVALALLLAVGVVALGNVVAARRRAEAAQRLAEDRAKLLETSMREARRKSDALLLSEVSRRLAADPAHALVQLVDYPADAAEWPRTLRLAIEAARLGLPEWVAHAGIHGGVAFAPGGDALAAVTDGSVAVFERRGGARTRSWPLKLDHFERVVDVSWLSGRSLLVALRGGRLLRFDEAPEAHVLGGAEHGALSVVTVSEDRRHAVTASADGSVTWYDLATGEARSLHRHRGTATDVCLLGGRAISVGGDGVVRASSVAAGLGVGRDLGAGALSLVAARHVRDGDEIVVATEHGDLLLLDGALQVARRLRHFDTRFMQLEWLAGSDSLIAVTNDHVVHSIKLAGEDGVLAPGDSFRQSFAGDWLVVAGTAGVLTLVDPHGAWRRTLKAHDGGITTLSLTADGAVVTAGADGTLRLWERSQRPVRVFPFEGMGASVDSYAGRDDFAVATDTGQLQLCRPSGECRVDRLPTAATTIVRMGRPEDPIVAADLASGVLHVRGPSLEELRRVATGGPLVDVRVNGSEILALGASGALYRIDAMRGDPVRIDAGPACARVTRIRWVGAARALLACGDTSLAILDVAAATLVSSPWVADAAAGASVNGLGMLGDTVVTLLDSGDVHRDRESRPLFGCAGRSSRMFEAQDGGAYLTDCGTQVRLVAPARWLESPPLAGPDNRIADFDAAVRHTQVAVGLLDRLVLWSYRDANLKVVGSSMVVYNVEMLEQRDRVLAASSPGSLQLWDLSGAVAVPTDPTRLADWIRGLSSHYRFENSPGAY